MVDTAEPPPADLTSLLVQASHALTARVGAELADLGLTARGYSVLARAAQVERTQVEVAELVGLDKTTMVVTLDGLEKVGLAQRRILPSDRRARVVDVTPEGRAVLERAHVLVRRVYDEVLNAFDAETTSRFLDCLTTMTSVALASHPGRRPAPTPPT